MASCNICPLCVVYFIYNVPQVSPYSCKWRHFVLFYVCMCMCACVYMHTHHIFFIHLSRFPHCLVNTVAMNIGMKMYFQDPDFNYFGDTQK